MPTFDEWQKKCRASDRPAMETLPIKEKEKKKKKFAPQSHIHQNQSIHFRAKVPNVRIFSANRLVKFTTFFHWHMAASVLHAFPGRPNIAFHFPLTAYKYSPIGSTKIRSFDGCFRFSLFSAYDLSRRFAIWHK